MFEECNTLAELNAARIKAVSSGADLMEANNAFNKRRSEIVNARKPYKVLTFITNPEPHEDITTFINVIGRVDTPGTIKCTKEGFCI